jgi:hypothetical protein
MPTTYVVRSACGCRGYSGAHCDCCAGVASYDSEPVATLEGARELGGQLEDAYLILEIEETRVVREHPLTKESI